MIETEIKQNCIQEASTYLLTKSAQRIKEQGEVFTPTELVLEILEQLPTTVWEDGKTYLDPTCGNGQFLAAVLIIKLSLNHNDALSTIYGVDIMQDNVDECRQRLIDIAGDTPANWAIVEHNILCKDGLTYDYSFGDGSEYKGKLEDESVAPKKEKVEIKEVENNFGDFFKPI